MAQSVATHPHCAEPLHLAALQIGIDPLRRNLRLTLSRKAIHPDNDGFATVHALLVLVGSVLDLLLDPTALDGSQHAAHRLNSLEVFADLLLECVRQRLDIEGT